MKTPAVATPKRPRRSRKPPVPLAKVLPFPSRIDLAYRDGNAVALRDLALAAVRQAQTACAHGGPDAHRTILESLAAAHVACDRQTRLVLAGQADRRHVNVSVEIAAGLILAKSIRDTEALAKLSEDDHREVTRLAGSVVGRRSTADILDEAPAAVVVDLASFRMGRRSAGREVRA